LNSDALPAATKVSAKPGEPDFSKLMGLGAELKKKSTTRPNVPVIVTTDNKEKSKKAASKKATDQ
jgi:hypothetical protein